MQKRGRRLASSTTTASPELTVQLLAKQLNSPTATAKIAEALGGMPIVLLQLEEVLRQAKRMCGPALDCDPGTSYPKLRV